MSKSKTPPRTLEEQVNAVNCVWCLKGVVAMDRRDCLTLLKAERRRVRLVVKKMIREIDGCSEPNHPTNITYRLALTDVLAALHPMGKK